MALDYAISEPRTRDSTPFLLTTGTTPPSIAIATVTGLPGNPVQLPLKDLQNTLHVPIEITELHFLVTETGGTAAGNLPGVYAGAWEISLALGAHQITRGFVPVCALEVRRDTDISEGFPPGASQSPIQANGVRWILPQPLIVLPNEGFSGAVRMSPNLVPFPAPGATQTCTISMVARGRRLPVGMPLPKKRCIPYASGWIFTLANTPGPDQTYQNLFQTVLHISSLNGITTAWGLDQQFPLAPTGTITMNSPGGLANNVIRGVVTAGDIGNFFSQRSALEEAHDLEPGEAHQITISQPTPYGGTYFANIGGVAINLVGWREE